MVVCLSCYACLLPSCCLWTRDQNYCAAADQLSTGAGKIPVANDSEQPLHILGAGATRRRKFVTVNCDCTNHRLLRPALLVSYTSTRSPQPFLVPLADSHFVP